MSYGYGRRTDNYTEKLVAYKGIEEQKMRAENMHVCVYLYSTLDHPGIDHTKLKLKGDLIIDIDGKDDGDIPQAIEWLHKLMDLLRDKYELDLDYCKWYASGSKGFHIEIPQSLFGQEGYIVHLNKFHSFMAMTLAEEAGIKIDKQIYHYKHTLRTANKKRNNGKYKVPLTAKEAREITYAKYNELTMNPRIGVKFPEVPKGVLNEGLTRLWDAAKDAVKDQLARAKTYSSVGAELLDVFNDTTIPACIEWMKEGKALKADVSFNLLKMNVAAFLAHAGNVSDKTKDALLQEFAENASSDRYPTAAKRAAAVLETVGYAQSGSVDFSCGSNCAVLTTSPCNDCPLKNARDAESAANIAIEAREDGYFAIGSKGDMRLTNFTLSRVQRVFELEHGQRLFASDVLDVTIRNADQKLTTRISMPATEWTSLAQFKARMVGAQGVNITMNDVTLAKLKLFLDQDPNQGEDMLKLEKAGINILQENGEEVRVWAEPGWAMAGSGCTGKYAYGGDGGDTILKMQGIETCKPDDAEVSALLFKLMASNRPEVVATCLGWAMACHLKEHLAVSGWSEFPLLHISGIPGSGKSMSATVYATLTGCQLPGGPMDTSNATPYPVKDAISQTTTVARVFDEFNRGSMRQDRYRAIQSILRAAYCRQDIATGTIAKGRLGSIGAATIHQHATSPVIYMAKEAIENEELKQRSVEVRIDKKDHALADYAENFETVLRSLAGSNLDGHPLHRFAKLLIRRALDMSSQEVKERYESIRASLPRSWHARLLNNVAAMQLGLQFLHACVADFPSELGERVRQLEEVLAEYVMQQAAELTKRSLAFGTAEIVMQSLAVMASIGEGDTTGGRIDPGKHYFRLGNNLYLKPSLLLMQYVRYCRASGIQQEVSNAESMTRLLKSADFCTGLGGLPTNTSSTGWLEIDLSQVATKGIDYEAFEEK